MATDKIQGEGDYKAAKEYDDAAKKFAQSGKVEQAARDAEPRSTSEAEELTRAEKAGLARSKGEEPEVDMSPEAQKDDSVESRSSGKRAKKASKR